MITLRSTACIDAPAEAVWNRLVALEDIPHWSETVLSAACPTGRRSGVGAVRICSLRGNLQITERWTEWNDRGHSFAYEASGIPLIKHAKNHWSVKAQGNDQALLISEAQIELKGGVFIRLLLERTMAQRMRLMGARSLAAFKYLVENGRPFEGRHANIPLAPVSC